MNNAPKPATAVQHTIQFACQQWSNRCYRQSKRAAIIAITTPKDGPEAMLERMFWRDAACSELAMAVHWRKYARRFGGGL